MTKIYNFQNMPQAPAVFYGGDAGAKDAIIFDNAVWMVKYPKTTRDLTNPQLSYTTSPLSEYLGSKIYESFGLPVHETLLGIRRNKVVVACNDFTREVVDPTVGKSVVKRQLIPFHDLKNSFMSSDTDSYSGSGSETLLTEVLATLSGQTDLASIPGAKERFWQMFVIDAFIGNNDRNNGNWGILIGDTDVTLAPVYDNGNAFFNKRSIAQMEKRIKDKNLIAQDAYQTLTCAYKYKGLDNEGHRINPFVFIASGDNPDCTNAVRWFMENVNMSEILGIIDGIPESFDGFAVMPEIQKAFYKELLAVRYNKIAEDSLVI